MKLVELKTNKEEHQKFCIEIAKDCLEAAEKGQFKNLIIAWEDVDGYLFDNHSGGSSIALLGLLDIVSQGIRNKFMNQEASDETR